GMYGQANRLDLISDNVEHLSRQLAQLFQQNGRRGGEIPNALTSPGVLNAYLIKIWVSGILFSISTVTRDHLDDEIEKMKLAITEPLRYQGFMPSEIAARGSA